MAFERKKVSHLSISVGRGGGLAYLQNFQIGTTFFSLKASRSLPFMCFPSFMKYARILVNKITSQQKSHAPPRHFLYLRETKSWKAERRERERGGDNVHLLTHAPARGMGKNRVHTRGGRGHSVPKYILKFQFQ